MAQQSAKDHDGSKSPDRAPKLWPFLRRAMFWRCPECGLSPIFLPMRRVRTVDDWLRPLDGCPRCGYAYEREQGYFLIAVWVLNYGVVTVLGLVTGFYILARYHPGLWSPMWLWLLPAPLLNVVLARHAKAIFLAVDHYCDPHLKAHRDDRD
jgi:uncharacterized protein (DUF983 family)